MESIGEYRVRKLLGEGGMGKVYEAEERLSRRRVALKVLRPELSRSDDARRLFVNEMQILAQLDHPNVVRCLACTEAEGELVMVLEYLEGRTLREELAMRGALPWAEAVGIAGAVAAALAAAHGAATPVVHRDLKPENVMLTNDGGVKVMDFGIAKVLQQLSGATTQSVGTLQYMSPEQIDAGAIDGRSDLYALGLLLYEMLAGVPPFRSASPRELLNLQCTARPPELPAEARESLPSGVERLLFELLEKRPEDRPGTAEDVLHELAPFVPAGRAGAASPRPASETAAARSARPSSSPGRVTPASHRENGGPPGTPVARLDTIALVERATAPRDVPPRTALAWILGLSLLAAVVTWWVRAHSSAEPSPAPTATTRPAR